MGKKYGCCDVLGEVLRWDVIDGMGWDGRGVTSRLIEMFSQI